MMDSHGSMVTEYNNMQIYKRIPAHLMINLKLEEGKMWKRSDGICLWRNIIERGRSKLSIVKWKNTWTCLVGI